jgi:hypothetical protein
VKPRAIDLFTSSRQNAISAQRTVGETSNAIPQAAEHNDMCGLVNAAPAIERYVSDGDQLVVAFVEALSNDLKRKMMLTNHRSGNDDVLIAIGFWLA